MKNNIRSIEDPFTGSDGKSIHLPILDNEIMDMICSGASSMNVYIAILRRFNLTRKEELKNEREFDFAEKCSQKE